MKILLILVSYKFEKQHINNIKSFIEYFEKDSNIKKIDIAGVSGNNDFDNYNNIISFKYTKIIPENNKKQLSKICDFITEYKNDLDYDWYIKLRPELTLLEPINFKLLVNNTINARAREYIGPKRLKYGCQIGGPGNYEYIKPYGYSHIKQLVTLDDEIYIFDNDIIKNNAFDCLTPEQEKSPMGMYNTFGQDEWCHTKIWRNRNIQFNVIDINVLFKRPGFFQYSGAINPL